MTTTITTNLTTAEVAELLELEIRCQVSGIRNALDTRKHHPTYGVTKADLWARYNQLLGLLYGWKAAANGQRSASVTLQASDASVLLEIDLQALAAAIKAA